MQPLKQMKIYPHIDQMLREISFQRKQRFHTNKSKQDIVAEIITELHKKEVLHAGAEA